MRERLQHYINGQWVDSEGGKRHEVINPATEEACCAITLGTQADVDKAVAAAQAAFRTFSKTTREERLALMERIVAESGRPGQDNYSALAVWFGPMDFTTRAPATGT